MDRPRGVALSEGRPSLVVAAEVDRPAIQEGTGVDHRLAGGVGDAVGERQVLGPEPDQAVGVGPNPGRELTELALEGHPGPVQQEFLVEPAAQPALVNGAGRAVAQAMNWTNYTGGAVAREFHPSGSTGSFGITLKQQRGELADDETNTHWNNSQRARWLAENAIAIISEAGESESDDEEAGGAGVHFNS